MRAQRTPEAISTLEPGAGGAMLTYLRRLGADAKVSPSVVTAGAAGAVSDFIGPVSCGETPPEVKFHHAICAAITAYGVDPLRPPVRRGNRAGRAVQRRARAREARTGPAGQLDRAAGRDRRHQQRHDELRGRAPRRGRAAAALRSARVQGALGR